MFTMTTTEVTPLPIVPNNSSEMNGGQERQTLDVLRPTVYPMHYVPMVRVIVLDYTSIRRCHVIPLSRLRKNLLLSKAIITFDTLDATPKDISISAVGEVYALPFSPYFKAPLPPLKTIPTHPNHSIAIAHMHDTSGQPWSHCPRSRLCSAISLLKDRHDISIRAGFEMQFILLQGNPAHPDSLTPFGTHGSYASHNQFHLAAPVIDHMVAALTQAAIPVTKCHAKSAFGQFEIVLHHKPLLQAVDELIVAREIVRAVALEHKLYATFIPKMITGAGSSSGSGSGSGSGSHVHLSLDNHFGSEHKLYDIHVGMSPMAQHFVAGILEALPWLIFLSNASVVSYTRLLPQQWMGVYKVWGISNREAPLRVSMDKSNIEFKLLDALSNPYIAMAGLICAGVNGIRSSMELPPPCQVDPCSISESKRPEQLPSCLDESLERFRDYASSGALEEVFPADFVQDLIAIKQGEIDYVARNGVKQLLNALVAIH